VQYLHVCPRKLWLWARGVRMDDAQDGTETLGQQLLAQGRTTAKHSYPGRPQRGRELLLDLPEHALAARLDYFDPQTRTLHETKHSPELAEAHHWQARFYLLLLHLAGLGPATAVLEYPNERRCAILDLTPEAEAQLWGQIAEIRHLAAPGAPCPPLQALPWCRSCAFHEFCHS
jgi:CRISPR-associated exonuclease Cas4